MPDLNTAMNRLLRSAFPAGAAATAILLAACQPNAAPSAAPQAASNHAPDEAASRAAFLAAYPVFMHPRCMNCHPAGDVPLQGEDSRLHTQNVKRGADGKGVSALRCVNCHLDKNTPGLNMPPGNPNWRLPPANMKMVFQGKSAAELARQLKDPTQTGKDLGQILHHVTEDSLVLGGWDPGEGRAKPPMSHADFVKHMKQWIETGAAIPQ